MMSRGSKADCAAHVHAGSKVLPITDAAQTSSSSSSSSAAAAPAQATKSDQCANTEKKERIRGEKMNHTIARMKVLLKWAAAARAHEKGAKYIGRKVLHFRNRSAGMKSAGDDDDMSNESPKISFRWDVESCSTTSSVYSAISVVASTLRNGHTSASVNSTPLRVRGLIRPRNRGNYVMSFNSSFIIGPKLESN